MSVEPRRGDGMVLAVKGVAHDHDPQVVGGDAGLAQGDELGDGVVFAISGAIGECYERRTPHVDFAVLSQIAHRPDREIDRAIDLAEAGASLAGSGVVHDGEELKGRRRHAAIAIAVAKRQLHPFVVELALDVEPFLAQGRPNDSVEAKRPNGSADFRIRFAAPGVINVSAVRSDAGPNQAMPQASTTARQACE